MAYNAFISYSHASDSTLAAALQSALHRFAKPWYKLRGLHVFRDQTNLAVNPALWSTIREALDQSQFLILLASPAAAASPWVAKEAGYWISRNGTSHVLIVHTGGTLAWDRESSAFNKSETSALPSDLLQSFSEEPLFVDLLPAGEAASHRRFSMREPQFHEAVLQLASTLRNRPKDELDGEDIRARRHTRWIAASACTIILVTGLFAWREGKATAEEMNRNLAATLAANSAQILSDYPDETRQAALLAIESTRRYPSVRGNQALRSAVSLLPASAQFYKADDGDPEERVRDMAFSPRGDMLAVVRDNGSTQLIDVANHKSAGYLGPDKEPAAHIELAPKPQDGSLEGDNSDNAVSVAFDATGLLVATAVRDGFVHVWSRKDGREVLRIFHAAPVSQVGFHPQANELFTAADDGQIRIFDIARKEMIAGFDCRSKIASAAYSPDGKFLAALSSDGPVYLFDLRERKLARKLFGGGEAALHLAFSSDGKRLATAMGSFAFVWDLATGQQLLKATHSESLEELPTIDWIIDAALSPNGKYLAYASRSDALARIWNVETGRQILTLQHGSPVTAVIFDANGAQLSTASYDGTSRVWEIPSGREIERSSHAGGAEVVTFSAESGRVASGGMDGSISISDMRRAHNPVVFHLPRGLRSLAFSPDDRHVALGARSAQYERLVRIGDTAGNVVRDIEGNGLSFDKLFFLDVNRLVGKWSTQLDMIDIQSASMKHLKVPELYSDIRIDPSGRVLASPSEQRTDLYNLPELQKVSSVPGTPKHLLFTTAGGKLLAFDTTQPPKQFRIDIWNVARKASEARITLPLALTSVASNPAGTILFTAEGSNLQAWEVPRGKQRFALSGDSAIRMIVPDPSSAAFATVTEAHLTVRDATTGTPLAEVPSTAAAAFSPSGRYLLTKVDDRSAALWLWRSSDLTQQACTRLSSNLSRAEWSQWLPKQPYRLTCPNLPAGK